MNILTKKIGLSGTEKKLRIWMQKTNMLQLENFIYQNENSRLKSELDQAMIAVEKLLIQNSRLADIITGDAIKNEIEDLIRGAG